MFFHHLSPSPLQIIHPINWKKVVFCQATGARKLCITKPKCSVVGTNPQRLSGKIQILPPGHCTSSIGRPLAFEKTSYTRTFISSNFSKKKSLVFCYEMLITHLRSTPETHTFDRLTVDVMIKECWSWMTMEKPEATTDKRPQAKTRPGKNHGVYTWEIQITRRCQVVAIAAPMIMMMMMMMMMMMVVVMMMIIIIIMILLWTFFSSHSFESNPIE